MDEMLGYRRVGIQVLKVFENNGDKKYLVKPEGVSQRVILDEEAFRFLFSLPLSDVVSFGRPPLWVRRKYKKYFDALENFAQHGLVNKLSDPKHGVAMTLKIVLGCNFGCKYCYEAQRMDNDIKKMPKKIIRTTIRKVAEFGGGSIALHGGEPGLYPEGIEYAAKLARKYAKRYKTYVRISVQTNGTAAYTALDILKEYQIPVGISYDGSYQDKYRVFKDGSSTREYVLKAIKILKENNIPIMGISVIDKDMDPDRVYKDNEEAGLEAFRMNPMYPVGHPILEDKMMDPARYTKMLLTALDKMLAGETVKERRIQEYVAPMWGMKPVVCISIPCMAGLNFFDIDIEGNVAVCDANPFIKIGNIIDGHFWDFMFHPDSIGFRFRWSEWGKPCYNCPFKYHCDGGGCEGFLELMKWPTNQKGPFCPSALFAKVYSLSIEDQLKLANKSVQKVFKEHIPTR